MGLARDEKDSTVNVHSMDEYIAGMRVYASGDDARVPLNKISKKMNVAGFLGT